MNPPADDPPPTASFGHADVGTAEKPALVRDVFDSVASRYDLMNDAMTAGAHRIWKRALIDWLRPRAGMRLLDLAGGTGDLARRFIDAGGGEVVLTDINEAMLGAGRKRDRAVDRARITRALADAEGLPFADHGFDCVTISFGIRNCTDIAAVLREARRVLKPGGRFLCLEFSRLALPGLARLYDAYSFKVIPRLGALLTGEREAYVYLVESIRRFPDQRRFAAMLEAAGLSRVEYRDLSGGIVAMHSGWKI